MDRIDELCINTIRTLSMDAVEKAKSGHPGTPMALAPIAYLLFTSFMKHNPKDPKWQDRDRFILSCGHASMLLYSILYLTGYDITLEDMKAFRQWGSKTPGHPEYGETPGVETTTGPLGQGCGNSVGMAIAEAHLAERFNTESHKIIDHYTYCLCSDGDMMEGISHEAASLAGHLRLGRLIWLYDDNHITIEGDTALSFSEDTLKRFEGYGWHCQRVEDVNDLEALSRAIELAKREKDRPSFIAVRSHIAYGAPKKQDTASAHGEPLGEEEVLLTKKAYGWDVEQPFYVPQDVLKHFRKVVERGREQQASWEETLDCWQEENPELAAEWHRRHKGKLPQDWDRDIPIFSPDGKGMATRGASGQILNSIALNLPELVGGSADLAPSNKTIVKQGGDLEAGRYGERNMHFGVREHAMGAIANGMALHSGIMPYAATFLIFSDYTRPALRLAAMMQTHIIYIFTHDSITLGEDGPTHQPVEHLMSLRMIPGLTVIRPADANETAEGWRLAVKRKRPCALILTRQDCPVLNPEVYPIKDGVWRGAYILSEPEGGSPDIILIATGFEVHLALSARDRLKEKEVKARVVSMPSWELFDEQLEEYKLKVLPPQLPKLAIEAGVTSGWREYVGENGDVIGINCFGASAPWEVVYKNLGFTVENVVEKAVRLLVTRHKTQDTRLES